MRYLICDAAPHPERLGAVVMTTIDDAHFATAAEAEGRARALLTERFRKDQRPVTLHIIAQVGHVSSGVPTIAVELFDRDEEAEAGRAGPVAKTRRPRKPRRPKPHAEQTREEDY